jgi:TatD DNase family protein
VTEHENEKKFRVFVLSWRGLDQARATVIDSHCHLADEVFAPDLDAVIERARAAGLERALVILEGGNANEATQAHRLAQLWPEVRVSIGVHPHMAHQFAADPARAAVVVRDQIAATPAARAVGEIGLDYHYDYSPRDVQQAVFRAQLAVARDLDLPVVIHTREADDDTIALLSAEGNSALRGVLHCFTGTPALAAAGLELGFYISLAGIITFPKAAELRDTVRQVPLDRLLTETDSPFLAPVPHRGKRNEPAYVARVVDALAALHGVAAEDLARQTSANFHSLFRP